VEIIRQRGALQNDLCNAWLLLIGFRDFALQLTGIASTGKQTKSYPRPVSLTASSPGEAANRLHGILRIQEIWPQKRKRDSFIVIKADIVQ
jgi:hypothetical protein